MHQLTRYIPKNTSSEFSYIQFLKIEDVSFFKLRLMWFLLVLALRDGNNINMTGTATESIELAANDDLFFRAKNKRVAVILHSINNIIASVNVHDGESIIQGYIGRESRSFGVYFGEGTGSATIHATEATNVTCSWTTINKQCTKMFVSEAPKETFSINADDPLRQRGTRGGNETIKPNTNTCFWHASVGDSVVDVNVQMPENANNDLTFTTAFNEEAPEDINNSCQIRRPYQGSFFGMLRVGKAAENVEISIDIKNTSALDPSNEYRTSFFPDEGPQFLMDVFHVPTPFLPSPTSETSNSGENDNESTVIAGVLMAICLICTVVMVVCFIYIYKKKQRQRQREIEVLIHMSEENDSSNEKPHMPIASCPAPIFDTKITDPLQS